MGITQKTEAVGMYSAEGEFVEFGHSVLLEGPVEVQFDWFMSDSPIKFVIILKKKREAWIHIEKFSNYFVVGQNFCPVMSVA